MNITLNETQTKILDVVSKKTGRTSEELIYNCLDSWIMGLQIDIVRSNANEKWDTLTPDEKTKAIDLIKGNIKSKKSVKHPIVAKPANKTKRSFLDKLNHFFVG